MQWQLAGRLFTGGGNGMKHKIETPCPTTRLREDPRPLAEKLFAQMALIRVFEEKLLELLTTGQLVGTTHACIGQEADAVGVIGHLRAGDVVFSSHRCHGHFLAWADRPDLLMAELLGRAGGLVGGKGGSQHICFEGFFSNGIQGGIAPATAGLALAKKVKGEPGICVVFLGDGTFGQGIVYETFNMASLWQLPVLFVVENNEWAQSSRRGNQMAGDLAARSRAFGIPTREIESTDAAAIHEHFASVVDEVRAGGGPRVEVIHTYRLCSHSRSDDGRPKDEIEARRVLDPIEVLGRTLDGAVRESVWQTAKARVDEAVAWAFAQPHPTPGDLVRGHLPLGGEATT